jgi:hypothetical protein
MFDLASPSAGGGSPSSIVIDYRHTTGAMRVSATRRTTFGSRHAHQFLKSFSPFAWRSIDEPLRRPQTASSFDHVVGAREQLCRDFNGHRFDRPASLSRRMQTLIDI